MAERVDALEIAAVALGFVYIVLAIRGRRGCWIAGGASSLIYIVVFARAGLPMQAALQSLYVGLSAYGWWAWRPAGGVERPPVSWRASTHLRLAAAVAVVSAISARILAAQSWSDAPWADSAGSFASVAATWMLARRCRETWLWWIAIDLGLASLFASQGLLFTAALYFAFAVLAVAGWRAWRRIITASA